MKSRKQYVDTTQWKTFPFTKTPDNDGLFSPVRGKTKELTKIEEGETPIITASGFNNGVGQYGDIPPTHKQKLTLSNNGAKAGACFWQEGDFAIGTDAFILEPAKNEQGQDIFTLNEMTGLFLATIINHDFCDKYDWDYKPSEERLLKETLTLPVDGKGNPDWAYMENFMSAIIVQEEQRIEKLS